MPSSLRSIALAALLPLSISGCATADQVQALEEKVDSLEKKVADLEARPAGAGSAVDPKMEKAAQDLYTEIDGLVRSGDMETAAAKGKEMKTKYGTTTTYKKARKILSELAVVGKPVPADWGTKMEKYWQGEGEVNLTEGTTLVVFWEVWCPHCRRHMPEMIKTYDNWNSKGLGVVGVTRITKSATEEKVTEFIGENKLNYPVAKENGDLAREFGVGGIPAAAVVKDGKIVWRGHPARLTDEVIGKLLG